METVLVTGGAGLIGSHIADELLKMEYDVIVLDDLSGGLESNVSKDARFIKGSILDTELLDRIFQENRISVIYHLAAYAAEGLSHFIRRFNYNNNLIGSVNLINQAVRHGVRCFVFTSSIAVYGQNQLPYSEETIPRPEDPYGIAKYAVEMDLYNAHEMFGLNFVIFRPHNVYGERQNIGDRYRNVVGIFMNRLLQGEAMPIFGDGSQTRAFTYISDVAIPIARSGFMPESYNQVYNVGSDKPHSVKDVAQEVASAFKVVPAINYLDARNEVQHAYSSHEKANRVFSDHIKNIELSVGIPRMAEWAKATGAQSSSIFENIEIHKNLPPSWNVTSESEPRST
jgi:UDP-glucose 4-epimerase